MNHAVNELVALVGGIAMDEQWNTSTKSSGHHLNAKVDYNTAQKGHEAMAKHHALSRSDHILHHIACSCGEKTEDKPAGKDTAGKTIPLDDNNSANGDDLKEFNN